MNNPLEYIDRLSKNAYPTSYNATKCEEIQTQLTQNQPPTINDQDSRKYYRILDKYNKTIEDTHKKNIKEKIIIVHEAITFLHHQEPNDQNIQKIYEYIKTLNPIIRQLNDNAQEHLHQQSLNILYEEINTIINKYIKIMEETITDTDETEQYTY